MRVRNEGNTCMVHADERGEILIGEKPIRAVQLTVIEGAGNVDYCGVLDPYPDIGLPPLRSGFEGRAVYFNISLNSMSGNKPPFLRIEGCKLDGTGFRAMNVVRA